MKTLRIESLDRDVEVLEKTRKISRLVQEEMLRDVIVRDGEPASIPAINADRAEETLVRLMCNLSQEEVDKLTVDEYELLKKEINKKK